MMWIVFPLVFLAGFVDSIAGGGGLISLPAYMAAGLPAHMALGSNKLSSLFGTAISTARFAKNGHIKWRTAVFSCVGALIGSSFGARIALLLSDRTIRWMMLVIVPAVTLFLIFSKGFGVSEKNLSPTRETMLAVIVSVVIGSYDGFFGPGTGTFLIIAFTAVLGLDLLTACGNAKAVNLASNLASVVIFILHGSVIYKIAIPCILCGILGNYLGSGLAMKKGAKIVRPAMLVVIALLLIKIIIDLMG